MIVEIRLTLYVPVVLTAFSSFPLDEWIASPAIVARHKLGDTGMMTSIAIVIQIRRICRRIYVHKQPTVNSTLLDGTFGRVDTIYY